MSHFSLIVATKDAPTDEVLRRELQPFHEFECTGTDDEFVQDIDRTEKVRAEFASHTETRLKAADGSLHDPFDDKGCWRPEFSQVDPQAPKWDSNRRIEFIPEGYVKVEIPSPDLRTFADYLHDWHGWESVPFGQQPDLDRGHKYGYALLGENGQVVKCIDRTNPNKRWDWWRVGGRYAGKFRAKGVLPQKRTDLSYEWKDSKEDDKPTGIDQCQKSALDMAVMKAAAVESRRRYWLECIEKSKLSGGDLFAAIEADRTVTEKWRELPEPRPRGDEYAKWSEANGGYKAIELMRLFDAPEIPAGQSLAEWLGSAPPLTCFAFLMDGKWAEKGGMGWWACVSNENANWQADFMRIFETVPDDYWLTVVDCHI